MVSSYFFHSCAFIAIVILSNWDNCNARITKSSDLENVHLMDHLSADDIERMNNPLKWIKKQVRKLNKEFGKNLSI